MKKLSVSGKTAGILIFAVKYRIVLGPINLPTARSLRILTLPPTSNRCGCSRKLTAHFQSLPNFKNPTGFNITHVYNLLHFRYQLARYITTNVFVHIFPMYMPIFLVFLQPPSCCGLQDATPSTSSICT